MRPVLIPPALPVYREALSPPLPTLFVPSRLPLRREEAPLLFRRGRKRIFCQERVGKRRTIYHREEEEEEEEEEAARGILEHEGGEKEDY